MRKLMYVKGCINIIVSILIAILGIQYINSIVGNVESSVADIFSSLSALHIVIFSAIELVGIITFVYAIEEMLLAMTMFKSRGQKIYMNIKGLLISILSAALVIYLIKSSGIAITDLTLGMFILYAFLGVFLVIEIIAGIANCFIRTGEVRRINMERPRPDRMPLKQQFVRRAPEERNPNDKPVFNFVRRG